ncbi:DNA-binding response regulator [Actinomycetota bacterium]|nr:DNA-binding response regulator [Actinomycetota bacterium]
MSTELKHRYTVVIIDDHDIFRAGVKSMLDMSIFEVVGEAKTVDEAVALIKRSHPDVALLDVHLEKESGADIINCVEKECTTKFLALSVSDSPQDVTAVVRAGALGYITKTITPQRLNSALEQVANGFTIFSPKLAGFVLSAFSAGSTNSSTREESQGDDDYDNLSRREREVLQLIARGYSYKDTAKKLFITDKTVESHVSSVLRKLRLTNRKEITSWASKRGMV